MSRIYVASSWRNPLQPEAVTRLRLAGHQVYDFRNPPNGVPGFAWSAAGMPDRADLTAETYRRVLTTSPICALGFMNDFRGMQWADVCVLLLPCGRSAHLEAGWFCGAGKRCIVLTQDYEEPELMALMATDICVSLDEVIAALVPFAQPNIIDEDSARCLWCEKIIRPGDPCERGGGSSAGEIACEACASALGDMLAEPESFIRDDSGEETIYHTAETARVYVDKRLAAGGNLTDKLAKPY